MEKEVIISASSEVPSDIKELRDFYDYWIELSGGGGVPSVDAIDPARLQRDNSNLAEMELKFPHNEIYFKSAGELINELANCDVAGLQCADVYGGPNWVAFRDILWDVAKTGVPGHVTQGYHSRAGKDYLMESIILPFLNENGLPKLLHSLTYAHDKDYQWPSYDEGGFIRHHHLVEDTN